MNNNFLNSKLMELLKNADKNKLMEEISKLDGVLSKNDMENISQFIDKNK